MAKIPSVTESALQGIQSGLRKLHEAAHEIATASVDRADPIELTDPLVRMLEAQRAIEASAVVMRRANAALDSILAALTR